MRTCSQRDMQLSNGVVIAEQSERAVQPGEIPAHLPLRLLLLQHRAQQDCPKKQCGALYLQVPGLLFQDQLAKMRPLRVSPPLPFAFLPELVSNAVQGL